MNDPAVNDPAVNDPVVNDPAVNASDVTDFEAFQRTCCERVDEALDRWLPDEAAAGDLAAAMRHIVFSGGKRLRPTLVMAGALHVGADLPRALDEALGAAVAVELVHAYSLLHDDLPCMDDAELRRGKPCAHTVWGEAMAVLAGDGLLTLAFEVLAARTPAGRPVGDMIVRLGRAAGWEGMVGGQVADLAAEGTAPDVERVRAIHDGKTAAMIAVSLQLGGLAAGGEPADVERLGALGRDLGLAFQIVDDLLDVEGTTEALGKAAGADADRSKMTWPAAVGVEQARTDAQALVDQALASAASGRAPELLGSLGGFILRRLS